MTAGATKSSDENHSVQLLAITKPKPTKPMPIMAQEIPFEDLVSIRFRSSRVRAVSLPQDGQLKSDSEIASLQWGQFMGLA